MLRRINVNSLVASSMHGQVRLLIALYVKCRDSNSAYDGLFKNGRADNLALPFYFARKSDVDRQKPHAAITASIANANHGVTKTDQADTNRGRRTARLESSQS